MTTKPVAGQKKWWMLPLLLAAASCAAGTSAGGARGTTDGALGAARESGPPFPSAVIQPTPALKAQWEVMKAQATWFVDTAITLSNASKMAMSLGLAVAEESLNVTEVVRQGVKRVYFGKMDKDGSTFLATAHFTVDESRVVPVQYPKAKPLSADLSARARAVLTIKAEFARLHGADIFDKLGRSGLHMGHFVRRLPNQQIEAWLIAVPQQPMIAVVGSGDQFLVSQDGAKVVSHKRTHRATQVLSIEDPKQVGTLRFRHKHDASEGDLPSSTDLFTMMACPALAGLLVLGPRYAVIIEKMPQGGINLSPIYDKEKLLRLMNRSGK